MKPIYRFSLRTLVSLPVIVALGMIVFDRLWMYDMSQRGTELVEISVVDSETRAPIAGAVLLSSDKVKAPDPKYTNESGTAAFADSYEYQHFKSLLRERHQHLSAHAIDVQASGYQPAIVHLESFRRGEASKYSLPIPIVVELTRSRSDGKGGS